jgi:hypothetical protein
MKFYPLRTEGTNTYSGDTLIVLSRTKPKVTEMCSKCWEDNAKMLESSASKIQSVISTIPIVVTKPGQTPLSRDEGKCTSCGLFGHVANNTTFHPRGPETLQRELNETDMTNCLLVKGVPKAASEEMVRTQIMQLLIGHFRIAPIDISRLYHARDIWRVKLASSSDTMLLKNKRLMFNDTPVLFELPPSLSTRHTGFAAADSISNDLSLLLNEDTARHPISYHCYCGSDQPGPSRAGDTIDLRCQRCEKYFHQRCLSIVLNISPLPGDWRYQFICANCRQDTDEETPQMLEHNVLAVLPPQDFNTRRREIFRFLPREWDHIFQVTLYNLKLESQTPRNADPSTRSNASGHVLHEEILVKNNESTFNGLTTTYFHFEQITEFLSNHWISLCYTKSKAEFLADQIPNLLEESLVAKTHIFKCKAKVWWGLSNYDNPMLYHLAEELEKCDGSDRTLKRKPSRDILEVITKKQKVSQTNDTDETSPRPGSLSFITNETSDVISHEDAEFETPAQTAGKTSEGKGLDPCQSVNRNIASSTSDRSSSNDADDSYEVEYVADQILALTQQPSEKISPKVTLKSDNAASETILFAAETLNEFQSSLNEKPEETHEGVRIVRDLDNKLPDVEQIVGSKVIDGELMHLVRWREEKDVAKKRKSSAEINAKYSFVPSSLLSTLTPQKMINFYQDRLKFDKKDTSSPTSPNIEVQNNNQPINSNPNVTTSPTHLNATILSFNNTNINTPANNTNSVNTQNNIPASLLANYQQMLQYQMWLIQQAMSLEPNSKDNQTKNNNTSDESKT